MGIYPMMPLGHIGIPLLIPIMGKEIRMDIRLLVLGAFLPDLIDKPLGHLVLSEDNGRILAHTLLFALALLFLGLLWRPCLPLSLGVSLHQILDGMFMDAGTSLWPLLGPFESYDFEITQWLDAYLEPYVIGEELIGLIIIIYFIQRLKPFNRQRLSRLLVKGWL